MELWVPGKGENTGQSMNTAVHLYLESVQVTRSVNHKKIRLAGLPGWNDDLIGDELLFWKQINVSYESKMNVNMNIWHLNRNTRWAVEAQQIS